jgi:quercetin dioxygenase-like cupin family protein
MATESSRDRPLGETSGSGQRPARRLIASSVNFDLETGLASLKQEASWLRGDRNARTLVEEPGLRVALTALKAGTRVREHRTDGWVSIQTTLGHLRVHPPEREVDLPISDVLALEPNVPHVVQALEMQTRSCRQWPHARCRSSSTMHTIRIAGPESARPAFAFNLLVGAGYNVITCPGPWPPTRCPRHAWATVP